MFYMYISALQMPMMMMMMMMMTISEASFVGAYATTMERVPKQC